MIIDAVQNSMLDKLVARLFPLLWIASMWERLSPSEYGAGFWILFFGVAGLWLLYSLLGAAADQSPKPRRRTPYDPVYEYPSNSFSVSNQPQKDSLRPPAVIRSLVMTFGVGGRSWVSIFEGLLFVGAFTLTWMLAYKSQSFWSDVDPRLAEQASREQLFLVASGILIALSIRGWAVEQRERLSPSTARAPILGSILLGVAFIAMLGMTLSDLLGFGLLPGVIGGVGLMAVALLPPWREKVLEFLFGKREPADGLP
ncbi:MAG: hypothetical protein Q8R45_13470 [Brevundimonas sp.]|uniref:hypothetical protein n=1 Tax=Brevundimonas sp. TaxID=1871086 RepID=UPI002732B1ED|nr:hypothetical protein [Brevundimonas sp.]MDP3657958.1 hypothetical protein [Brevundimonas sp.]